MGKSFAYRRVLQRLGLRLAMAWRQARRGAALADPRLGRSTPALRRLITRLGVAITCITIVAPPVTYAVLGAHQLQQRALEQASVGARHVEVQLLKGGTVDWLAQVSISVVHATQGANSPVIASWVTDRQGAALMFQGGVASWPEFKTRAQINAPGFQGYFYVAVSTRDLFIGTLYAALAFCFSVWRPTTASDACRWRRSTTPCSCSRRNSGNCTRRRNSWKCRTSASMRR